MKKYLLAAAVVTLLVIFPLVSWYYLDSGFKFRKEALTELTAKAGISPVLDSVLDLRGKTVLLHQYERNAKKEIENLKLVFDQYGDTENFEIVSFLKDTELYLPSDSLEWRIQQVGKELFEKEELLTQKLTLLDHKGNIRQHYDSDDESFKKLVQHISIVLPRQKDPDIVLKRNSEK